MGGLGCRGSGLFLVSVLGVYWEYYNRHNHPGSKYAKFSVLGARKSPAIERVYLDPCGKASYE